MANKKVNAKLEFQENVSIELYETLSADGKYSGITETGTAGEALDFGEVCYLATDGDWELAKADAVATSKGRLGICVLAATGDGEATKMLTYGKVRGASPEITGLTVGAPVFISAATAGVCTSTAPTTTNFVVRIIGSAVTATCLFFNPDCAYAELA